MQKLIFRLKLWYYQRRGFSVAVYTCPYCATHNLVKLPKVDGTDIKPCDACKKDVGVNVKRGRFNGVVGYGEATEK